MTHFDLAAVPPMTTGPGARDCMTTLAARHGGRKVFLVADPGLERIGLIDDIDALLREGGCAVARFINFTPDPTTAQVEAAREDLRSVGADLVIGLGGGSALDLAKAVAGLAASEAPVADFALSAREMGIGHLPFIAVPTTAGSGSEMTRTSVLTLDSGAKAWFWDEAMRSAHAVLDPELTIALPPGLTAATGLDAFVHALEAVTNRSARPENEVYAHSAIRLVLRYLKRAVDDGGDVEARAGVQYAAALAGCAINNCGTGIAHAIGHALGSACHVHHGRAVSLSLLAALPLNIENDDGRFARVAEAMNLAGVTDLPDAFDRLVRDVRIKVSLDDDRGDVTAEDLARRALEPENVWMCQVNYRQFNETELVRLCETVLTQH